MKYLANEAGVEEGGETVKFYTKNSAGQFELFPPRKRNKVILFLICLVVILVSGALIGSAFSQETVIGTGIVCDTKGQVERVVQADYPQLEINVINDEVETTPCAVMTVAYAIVEQYEPVEAQNGEAFAAAKIVVTGIATAPHIITPIPPLEQYTVFKVEKPPGIQV